MSLLDRLRGARRVRVHLLLKGRIGDTWLDVDETLRLPERATLAELVDAAEAAHIPLRHAMEHSPHLAHTLMINGDRCPFEEHAGRVMLDGDRVYLLAPLAGG